MSILRDGHKKLIERFLSIPREKWVVDSEDLRNLSKDFADLQEFFGDLLSDEDYERCICWAVLDFNGALPQTMFSPANFPDAFLLLKKALVESLNILEIYHAKNYFTGASGGVQVPIHERFQALQPIRERLTLENKERQAALKSQINAVQAFGGTDQYIGLGLYGSYYGY